MNFGADDAQSGIEWVTPTPPTQEGASPAPWHADTASNGLQPNDPRRRRTRRAWVAVLTVAVLAGGASGAWVLLKPERAVKITVDGARVDNAGQLTRQGDSQLVSYAKANLGTVSKSARCYFTRAADGHTDTDVESVLRCGPVLFYDGKAPDAYLSFAMSPSSTATKDHVTLVLAREPKTPSPEALPAGGTFVRPDHKKPPAGVDGLVAPIPPPAAGDLFRPVDAEDLGVMKNADASASMGSRDYGLRLVSSGYVTHVGRGNAERSAAAGHKLFAFAVDLQGGENPQTTKPRPDVALQVDSARGRKLSLPALPGVDHYFVASVPDSTKSISLVMKNAGYTQRMSALTGAAAKGNIAVLRGTQTFRALPAHGSAVGAVTPSGSSTFTAHLDVTVDGFRMEFFTPNGQHPSNPGHAYLYVDTCYKSSDFVDSTTCHSFRGTDLQLTPRGGSPIVGIDVGKDDFGYCVFEVAASFKSGTFAVKGQETGPDGWHMTITQPYEDRFRL